MAIFRRKKASPQDQRPSEQDHKGRSLGLTEVLVALSDELAATHQLAVAKGVATTAWTDASVQIEVALELTATGGVKFWVANVEGAVKRARSTTLTVNIRPASAEERANPEKYVQTAPITGDTPTFTGD